MEQKRVTLASGIELDVVDVGSHDAPVLLFLHGFPESHRTWRHQIAHLSARYRCIAPDQRGYRGSSKPQDVAGYTVDKLVGDVFQLADALGVTRFTVLGHDWGGAIAWIVAALGQGTRVDRAVLANAPHPVIFQRLLHTDPMQRAASQYIRAFRDPAHDDMIRKGGLGPLLHKAIKWNASPALEPEERAALLAEWADPDTAFAMLNWYRASSIVVPPLDAPFGLPEGYTPPPLPPLGIPTLVIWGMDDLALPPANMDGLEAQVRDLTIQRVPDCGHFVPWEAPAAVNAALDAFLDRTDA
ncbi:MAG: alpha/beta hydrolase [Novosphingobium sp. 12-64-8]|nr:MAG: alpha/beta hydrolase [Novosphingobium sp. 12-64-8]